MEIDVKGKLCPFFDGECRTGEDGPACVFVRNMTMSKASGESEAICCCALSILALRFEEMHAQNEQMKKMMAGQGLIKGVPNIGGMRMGR